MFEYDENNKVVDVLDERNKQIIKKLQPVVDGLLAEKKGRNKIGFRFMKQLQLEFANYGQMDLDFVARMNFETLNHFWTKFLELIAYYNRFFEVVDNKQIFMLYCGINDDIYSQWEQSTDEKLRNLMKTINSSFIGFAFLASESGNANSTAIKTRLSAKSVGHNVVSANDEMISQAIATRTPYELDRELKAILGIAGKKKS